MKLPNETTLQQMSIEQLEALLEQLTRQSLRSHFEALLTGEKPAEPSEPTVNRQRDSTGATPRQHAAWFDSSTPRVVTRHMACKACGPCPVISVIPSTAQPTARGSACVR